MALANALQRSLEHLGASTKEVDAVTPPLRELEQSVHEVDAGMVAYFRRRGWL
jgi:peptidase E